MAAASENRSRLWITASVVWVAWLLGILAMWLYYQQRAAHPHFLPLLSLLLIQFAGGLVLFVSGLWRVLRGPHRATALGWLLLGTAPLWFASAHFSHGAWSLYGQHAALTAPVKLASATVAALADAVARYRHPRRSAGDHVILFHDSSDRAAAQLETIDRHIEQMEALLGRSPDGKIHWIRGPVFDHEGAPGWYLNGLAIVTSPSAEVDSLDRHEVAHAVIDRHCGPDAQPPLVLVEGWAESQSGYEPGFLALRAWRHRQHGERLSLQDLTADGWYASGDWPVYHFGGALVEYLLDEFGGRKFLELYSTCRRDTFPEDCRRVLGVDLDELDRQYWDFVEDRVRQLPPEQVNPLLDVPLAGGVDREAWMQFAHEYADATDRLNTSLRQAQFEFSIHRVGPEMDEQTSHFEIIHDGHRHRMVSNEKGLESVTVACPNRSFLLTRYSGAEAWTLEGWDSQWRRSEDYWANLRWIHSCQWYGGTEVFQREFLDNCHDDSFRVTRFTRSEDGGKPMVRLDFEYVLNSDAPASTGWFTFRPGRSWAMDEYEIRRAWTNGELTVYRGSFEYADQADGSAIPQTIHYEFESPRSSLRETLTIQRCEFKPAADDAFRPQTFGVSASAIEIRYWAPWYVVWPAIAGTASLVVGLLLLVPPRRHLAVKTN